MVYNPFNIFKKKKPTSDLYPNRFIFGFVDEINVVFASGWVCDVNHINDRLVCEAVISDTGEVLAFALANSLYHVDIPSVGDGKNYYAFWIKFSRELTSDERDKVIIRIQGTNTLIPFAPQIRTVFQPFAQMAMDIVNNCNLRCPFCLYDYSSTKKTYFMSEKTLDILLKLLPYVDDGQFWFSCLHEPALHPQFEYFLQKIPQQYRKKISFTTNLAKKMPDSYFEFLATSNIDHINISIESFVPQSYVKFRKGARYQIFMDNLERLATAMNSFNSITTINYIAMAYKTNFKEFPEMYQSLINKYHGSYFEMRDTFDLPFIAQDFKDEEFLSEADWDWLEDQFKYIDKQTIALYRHFRIQKEEQKDYIDLDPPPIPVAQEVQEIILNRQFTLRVSWDGAIEVFAKVAPSLMDRKILETNVNNILNPKGFYEEILKVKQIL
ncbi:Radical SAM superfamily maturase [Commensalibacter communis]|uniref:SkfB/NifB/PqqE family (SkfB) n=1 Tax=Commensalibacter communis TaxID=2972786 RepID=A0A9W4X7I1_9PROT|nr:radical SAM protein [Commensalibacter communis]CAI3949863.1 Radical SAM superfamily maturase [Commensalibacter communis]CAI3950045.1 Radical SAM superfamily maturase [Commensalibacter communis]CAI3951469.1 Radical SAM superfamily maturase [Commensalibacter communis]CAI3953166.1 Radical SAM superfamily maturase [Commensalibacter communis]CAI3954313.1 Radical SAM superfamily maturase [Commensalibacter communis]